MSENHHHPSGCEHHDHEKSGEDHDHTHEVPPKSEKKDDHHDCCGGHSHESSSCGHDHGEAFSGWKNPSLILGSIATIAGLIVEHFLKAPEAINHGFYILGMVAGGWFLVPEAVQSLFRFRPNINALVVIASVGAAIIGAWGEASVVVVLFSVAEWLESYSVGRARKAISQLLDLAPPQARVKKDSGWVLVPLQEVVADQTIEIMPGERIPLDAIVLEGASDVNQAPITGEPLPVDKKEGDSLFAGTLNGSGLLIAKVTKPYKDSTLAKIIQLVEEAQEQRAPTQRFIEKFSSIYTPLVPVVAFLVFLIPVLFFGGSTSEWAYRAFTVLVIACPCALVVSTPVSIVCGLTVLARKGVLIKGGAYLELIGKMKALAVDKTGTITEGRPQVQEVIAWNSTSPQEILRIASSLDLKSTHPLARAVVQYAKNQGVTSTPATEIESRSGRGNLGSIEGHRYFVGNHRFAHELGVCTPELEQKLDLLQDKGLSVVIVGHQPHDQCAGEILGILTIGDTVRSDVGSVINALKQAGLQKIVMLSGDNQKSVDAVAALAGISEAHGNLLPEDKKREIQKLKETYGIVGMVGDGINDAPALATASFGIAMGAGGSDTAIETADIALMQDDLHQLPVAMKTSQRVLNTIRWNIGFAMVLKSVFLILGIMGHTSLWLAILADTGATVLVVANAMRLLKEH